MYFFILNVYNLFRFKIPYFFKIHYNILKSRLLNELCLYYEMSVAREPNAI